MSGWLARLFSIHCNVYHHQPNNELLERMNQLMHTVQEFKDALDTLGATITESLTSLEGQIADLKNVIANAPDAVALNAALDSGTDALLADIATLKAAIPAPVEITPPAPE